MKISFTLCSYCKIRPATQLCDAPIGKSRYIAHPPKSHMKKLHNARYAFVKVEMEKVITCDRPICEICATRIAAGVDFCPTCMEKIRTIPTKYAKEKNV